MAFYLTKEMKCALADCLNGGIATLPNHSLRLFQNNFTITDTTLNADFTVATFNGYANGLLASPTSAVIVNGKARVVYAPKTWTKTAGGISNQIYGWYATTGTVAIFCEKFDDGPYDMTTTQKIVVVPAFTLTLDLT